MFLLRELETRVKTLDSFGIPKSIQKEIKNNNEEQSVELLLDLQTQADIVPLSHPEVGIANGKPALYIKVNEGGMSYLAVEWNNRDQKYHVSLTSLKLATETWDFKMK